MSFDPFQRECLAAMGYAVYALADRGAVPADADAALVVAGPAAGEEPSVQPAVLRALVRAAGGDPADARMLEVCRGLLPAGGLPDARARRALWPQLRALRARTARG